jgi:hypothetical protein
VAARRAGDKRIAIDGADHKRVAAEGLDDDRSNRSKR